MAHTSELLGVRLKEMREEKELTQKAVAEKLGVAVSTYANWEQGRREPDIFYILKLLKVLEIEANELFDIKWLAK